MNEPEPDAAASIEPGRNRDAGAELGVVIVTFNAADEIAACLESLLSDRKSVV